MGTAIGRMFSALQGRQVGARRTGVTRPHVADDIGPERSWIGVIGRRCRYAGEIDSPESSGEFVAARDALADSRDHAPGGAAGGRIAADRAGERAGGERAAWLSFTGCLIAVFMQMVDGTIVTTALPSITADLAASRQAQLLVISGYSLAFACMLLTAARIGELVGRRTMFLASVVVFTAASVWCGMSGSAAELVAARVVQGIAAAGMAAQTIAIATASFPRHRHQPVFAIYGAVAGFAGMLGPIRGGALVTADPFGLGWHSVFLVNLPLGLITLALASRYLHLGRPAQRERLDLGGAALSTVSLFALLYTLTDIQENGWRTMPLTRSPGPSAARRCSCFSSERRRGPVAGRWCGSICSPTAGSPSGPCW